MTAERPGRLGDVAVSFSGGLDTTVAVGLLLDHFERVHLLTYCNGYCLRAHASHDRITRLREVFGRDRIVARTSAMPDTLNALLGDYPRELREVGSPLIFDLCCRLGMEVETIRYCLDRGIAHAADGLNCAQPVIFMLEPEYIAAADRFVAEYGIQFLHPVYHFGDREARREALRRHGLDDPIKPLQVVQQLGILPQISEQLRTQPLCYAQAPIFVLTSPLRNLPLIRKFGLPLDDALAFRETRQVIARRLIEESHPGAAARATPPADARPRFPAGL